MYTIIYMYIYICSSNQYACEQCLYSTKRKGNLARHTRTQYQSGSIQSAMTPPSLESAYIVYPVEAALEAELMEFFQGAGGRVPLSRVQLKRLEVNPHFEMPVTSPITVSPVDIAPCGKACDMWDRLEWLSMGGTNQMEWSTETSPIDWSTADSPTLLCWQSIQQPPDVGPSWRKDMEGGTAAQPVMYPSHHQHMSFSTLPCHHR